jgi:hypothetical protein
MSQKITQSFRQPIESDSHARGFSETTKHTDRPTPLLSLSLSVSIEKK